MNGPLAFDRRLKHARKRVKQELAMGRHCKATLNHSPNFLSYNPGEVILKYSISELRKNTVIQELTASWQPAC